MDVIVHSERLSDDLLFHELVHVVQYEVLGLKASPNATSEVFFRPEVTPTFH